MGSRRSLGQLSLFIAAIILPIFLSSIVYADDPTIADVANAQDDNESNIQTMHARVDSVFEFNGQQQPLSYEYTIQQDDKGNRKMMVHSFGTFEMQYMVDLGEMSVSILMADGSIRKTKLTDDQIQSVQKISGIGGLSGKGNLKSYYASLLGKKVSDASFTADLKTSEIETDKLNIKVKKESWGDRAVVEFTDKDAQKLKFTIDEKIMQAKQGKATTYGGLMMKKRFLDKVEKNRDSMLKYNVTKRVQKINLHSGLVEEQEWFNDEGKSIMRSKIKRTEKRKVRVNRRKKVMALAGTGTATDGTYGPDTVEAEITLPAESETETDTAIGLSKSSSKWSNITVNEPVDMNWIDVNKLRAESAAKMKEEADKVKQQTVKNKVMESENGMWKEKK